jgi:hypothetical protein
MELSKLTDKELCQVKKIFDDCDRFEYEQNKERILKINELYAFGTIFVYWIETCDTKNVYSAIVYAKLGVLCAMAERFYEKHLVD